MRKYKRRLAQNKKILAALATAISLGLNCPVYAADAVVVGAGTEDSPSSAENPSGTTIDNYGIFGSEGGSVGMPPLYFFGMAALSNSNLNTSPDGELTKNSFGNYALLTNNGIIRMNYYDVISKYGTLVTDGTYFLMMGRGMTVGTYSTLINNGSIYMTFNEGDYGNSIDAYYHAMFANNYSTMINNGLISLDGAGSPGANIRGMTTTGNHMTMQNYGKIYIDVGQGEMARALANTGPYSVLENFGDIYVRSNARVYGMSKNRNSLLLNYGTINSILNASSVRSTSGSSIAAILEAQPAAIGMAATSGSDDYETYKVLNTGVINVSATGNYTEATTPAVGVELGNFSTNGGTYQDTGIWYIENTGVINTSSVVQPSADNNYIVRATEIGMNLASSGSAANAVNAKIGRWATTLRDFATTKDFLQITRHVNDSNGDYPYSLDLSSTNLILRPENDYTAGTSYLISADTLVTPVDGNSLDSLINISGIDSMVFSSEMSDFIKANVTNVSDGVYNVSLVPNNNANTKKLISAAAMNGVDFTRANLDQISHELERNDKLKQKWFITPYYSKFKRDEGMSGHAHGFIAGSDWQISDKSFLGIHAAYALGGADKGVYSADSKLKSFLGGLHWTIYPQENKNWIRTQATYFHNSGDTSYTMNTDTSTLNGKSSNKSNGVYLAANYGFKNELSEQNELRTELGLSYLNMSDSPTIHWNLLDSEISGYDMKFDKYNAFHATAKTSLIHNFNDNGSLLFSLGVRGRLAGKKVKMNMMNTDYSDSVKEDSAQGLVELSYRHKINKFYIDAGYQGILGSKVKNHLFHTSLKWSF